MIIFEVIFAETPNFEHLEFAGEIIIEIFSVLKLILYAAIIRLKYNEVS